MKDEIGGFLQAVRFLHRIAVRLIVGVVADVRGYVAGGHRQRGERAEEASVQTVGVGEVIHHHLEPLEDIVGYVAFAERNFV